MVHPANNDGLWAEEDVLTETLPPQTTLPAPWHQTWAGVLIGGVVVCLLALGGSIGWALHRTIRGSATSVPGPTSQVLTASPVAASPSYTIKVDVVGDVRRPGVVSLPDSARVQDAVTAAGGFRHTADVIRVNGAALLSDGEEVIVPAPQPTAGTLSGVSRSTSTTGLVSVSAVSANGNGTPIDLNTASAATLETLPDIGPGRASGILAFRQSHGPFNAVGQLRQVHGIGPIIYAHIAPFLTVGG